jgi:hypothetical protein
MVNLRFQRSVFTINFTFEAASIKKLFWTVDININFSDGFIICVVYKKSGLIISL